MSVHRSGDPLFDFAMREREQQEWEDSLPCCERCKEKIDDYVYDIDGEILCIQCIMQSLDAFPISRHIVIQEIH